MKRPLLSKKDLLEGIHGIEKYVPGDSSARSLWIGVTSGSTDAGPTMVIRTISSNPERIWVYSDPNMHSFIRLSNKRTSQLKSVQTLLSRSQISRALCIEQADLEHPKVLALIASFEGDTVHASPIHLLNTLSVCVERGEEIFMNVRQIVLAGEQTTPRIAEFLQENLPDARLLPEYALIETDLITKPCENLNVKYPDYAFRAFHPLPSITFEIMKQDSDGVGDIVVSTDEIQGYKTGDLGKLVEERCPCGATRTLLVEGRSDFDVIHCAGATFRAASFEKLFERLKGKMSDYQVELEEKHTENGMVGKVRVLATPLSPFGDAADMATLSYLIGRLQVTPTRTLQELTEGGIFSPAEVVFLDALPVSSGKKRRLKKI